MTIIFTDGSSRGNPGRGGWGAIIVTKEWVKELGGSETMTTNNRMELKAAIEAVRYLGVTSSTHVSASDDTTVYSDSSYVINGITKWVAGWKRNNWLTSTKDEVQNRDLWVELSDVSQNKRLVWKYVSGHVGVSGNERCDEIATKCADGEDPELFDGAFPTYPIKDILSIKADDGASAAKKSSSSRSNAKAYSYVSFVGGKISVDHTWADCERRVKGVAGARYKKALNKGEESVIISEFTK